MPRSLFLSLWKIFPMQTKGKEGKGRDERLRKRGVIYRWSTSETPEPISLVAPRMLVHVYQVVGESMAAITSGYEREGAPVTRRAASSVKTSFPPLALPDIYRHAKHVDERLSSLSWRHERRDPRESETRLSRDQSLRLAFQFKRPAGGEKERREGSRNGRAKGAYIYIYICIYARPARWNVRERVRFYT